MYRPARAVIFKQSMRARNQVGIGLSYRPARLRRLPEFIPWNQFHKRLKKRAQATKAGGIDSLKSIPEILKHLQIRALAVLSPSHSCPTIN
jgi:hypothetical protein